MGLVYTLSVNNLQKVTDPTQNISLKTLKKYLINVPHKKEVLFICLDRCQSCQVVVDGVVDNNSTSKFDDFLDDSVKTYSYDSLTGMQEKDTRVFFNSEDIEESVCFSYAIDGSGVGEQVFVEYRTKVYDFTHYGDEVFRYNSLSEAQEKQEQLKQEVQR